MSARRLAAAAFVAWAVAQSALAQPAATDDRYQFVANASQEQPLTFERTPEGVRFKWPRLTDNRWDTALLAVRSLGAEASPSLDISAGAGRVQVTLDTNAVGLRWVNISGLKPYLSSDTVVTVTTRAVTLDPSATTVRLFTNDLDLRRSILVLAPHPDDAEIAAFGLYAGRNATIVTLTSGNAGDFNYRSQVSDPAEHYRLKGYLRAVDSVTVPWQGEIPPERCFNLGYFDARLAEMRVEPDRVVPEMYGPNEDVLPYRRANIGRLLEVGPRTNTWNHLVDDLVEILRKVKPAVIVMPHPMLDSHLDHAHTAVAVVDAMERWKSDATFLLYTNHASENLYPFGPAGTGMTLPPWHAADVVVDRVYSHPLDTALQRRKLFALESMHDLRLSPAEQDSCDEPGAQRRPDYPRTPAVDYLRRGPRTEEVFFVYGRDGVSNAVRSFLASRDTQSGQ